MQYNQAERGMIIMDKLGENLLRLRKEAGKTLRDVASSVGLTATALASYENGSKTPLLSNALKLAEYYGVTVEELCGMEISTRKQTLVDLYRAMMLLLEHTERTRVTTEDMDYVKSPVFNEFDFIPSENEDAFPTQITHVTFDCWMWPKKGGHFIRDYRNLRTVQESGLLDPSVLEIWLAKQYDDAARLPLDSGSPDLGV